MTHRLARLMAGRLTHDIQFYDRRGEMANVIYGKMIEASLRRLVLEATKRDCKPRPPRLR